MNKNAEHLLRIFFMYTAFGFAGVSLVILLGFIGWLLIHCGL